ncbi:MAG TPA: hypothetical protein PLG47_04015 [Candidatus Dojkabacteria bacterium]|nr:hypothetical protein [Candidatus Dojkabacteria bacterium]
MRTVIVYDLASCPDGIDLYKVIEVCEKHNIILYDAKKGKDPIVVELTTTTFLNRIKLLWFKISKYFSCKLTKN